jgi:hypothetical protein
MPTPARYKIGRPKPPTPGTPAQTTALDRRRRDRARYEWWHRNRPPGY